MYSDSNTMAAGIGSSSSATVNQRNEEKWTAGVIKLKFKYGNSKKIVFSLTMVTSVFKTVYDKIIKRLHVLILLTGIQCSHIYVVLF